ncbi:calcineurin-like phosphoesterase [Nitzschia inconspicua]|uniref:Calcineurin-like phosphoesterase n=1 Tax=Nitzschia inconspicua TaxID=303405 RepID=A0A9K3L1F2_9STRA|nr:calcineurin-like phosphoesterase [Nitzschia inconspicua]
MYFQDWIKQNYTSDESLPSDAGVDAHSRVMLRDGRSTSSESTSDYSNDTVEKKRRFALYAGCFAIVVVAVAIAVSTLLATGVFEKEISPVQDQEGFDFSDLFGSNMPSIMPVGTLQPTITPFPTGEPSNLPSDVPSEAPSSTFQPSISPTVGVPSSSPTWVPTMAIEPISRPPVVPMDLTSETLMTFCVIADVPYNQVETEALPGQIATQMDGCEFMVHLGDLFNGDTFCDEEDYQIIRDMMLESKVPTFVVVGDNEWNDCQRGFIEIGWERWVNNFMHFENHWAHNFTVVRQPGYQENFYFIHKRTLIIGLNVVGGRVHNSTEWTQRLRTGYEWTRSVIDLNLPTGNADGVIILSHANPSVDHLELVVPFRNYVANELENKYPILYLHGDGHSYIYTPHYMRQSNLLRIQHEGGTNEPILKIMADPARYPGSVYDAFQVDRQLELMDQ